MRLNHVYIYPRILKILVSIFQRERNLLESTVDAESENKMSIIPAIGVLVGSNGCLFDFYLPSHACYLSLVMLFIDTS